MELIIPNKSYQRMLHYARAVESEIAGLADVDWDEEHQKFTVGDVYLLKQKASFGNVVIVEGAADELMIELFNKGKTQSPRLWWHSHYVFDAFFSTTDKNTLEEKARGVNTFYVAVCINRKGELKCDMVVNTPEIKTYRDVKITVDFEIPATLQKEVTQKVAPMKEIDYGEFKDKFKTLTEAPKSWLDDILGRTQERVSTVDQYGNLTGAKLSCWLPWSTHKAIRVIKRKQLLETFDPVLHEWGFLDALNDRFYRIQKGSPVEGMLDELTDD